MITASSGSVLKQFKNVSLSSYNLLCSSSCGNRFFSKYFLLVGISGDFTLLGSSRSYSSYVNKDILPCNPFQIKQRMLTPISAYINQTGTRNNQSTTAIVASNQNKLGGFFKKLFSRNKYGKSILSRSGYLLYADISVNTDVLHFFKVLSLEDTFFSWFLVMELQIWLVAARLGTEGDDGKIVRDNLIKAFWEDLNAKIKELGVRPVNKNSQINELNSHFQTSLIGYDEGLLSCDRTLACAVWRNIIRRETGDPFFISDPAESSNDSDKVSSRSAEDSSKVNLDDLIVKPKADPRALEAVVCYIRKQMFLLDQVPSESLLKKGVATWTKLEAIS